MKAVAQIKDLNCNEEKNIVLRNLIRILDIKIIDIENGTLCFLYASPIAFQNAKQELLRIGHPMQSYNCTISSPSQITTSTDYALQF